MGRPDASTFQRFLQAAWSAWSCLDSTMKANCTVHIDDIRDDFKACAGSIKQVCAAIRPDEISGISDNDRETINKILLGEKGIPNLLSLEELLEAWEMELNLSPSEKTGWDAMAKEVNDACARLAETLGVQRD
jgi:hypothetical protein